MGLDEIIHFEIIQNCKSLDSVIISGCENERLLVTKNLDNNLHNWAQIFSELYLNIKKGSISSSPILIFIHSKRFALGITLMRIKLPSY